MYSGRLHLYFPKYLEALLHGVSELVEVIDAEEVELSGKALAETRQLLRGIRKTSPACKICQVSLSGISPVAGSELPREILSMARGHSTLAAGSMCLSHPLDQTKPRLTVLASHLLHLQLISGSSRCQCYETRKRV